MKRDYAFFAIIGIICIILIIIPTGFENPEILDGVRYEKAEVLNTDDTDLRQFSIITTGSQNLKLKIKTGEFKGTTIDATNVLLGQKKLDKIFKNGDNVLAVIRISDDGKSLTEARAADYYRSDIEIVLFICFMLFLVLFAKVVGVKAILSFVFTALAFWKLLIPMYLSGYNPIFTAIIIVFFTTTVIVLLVGGLNRKGYTAVCGAISGVVVTAILAIGFGYFFRIPGTVQEFSESLLYTGISDLNISDIFISVIFVSSAGAVMDVSMDISAAMSEINDKRPDLTRIELIRSGFRVAAPVIGSMTTTLLFAYSGSFMFAFMTFMAKGTPMTIIANTSYISAEILHTLVGSFGLVCVAPLTAIVGGYIFKK